MLCPGAESQRGADSEIVIVIVIVIRSGSVQDQIRISSGSDQDQFRIRADRKIKADFLSG